MGVAPAFKEVVAAPARAEPFTVLFVGDLIPSKGVRVVLNARRLLGPNRRVRHVFIGSGPLLEEVRRSGCTVVPAASAEQVAARLDESHVLVLPSRSEGTPLSVLEALCRGVPVIATRVGGIPEWVLSGREGLLLRAPASPHALARSIARVHDDRDLWQRLHEGALNRQQEILGTREVAARFLASIRNGHGVT
jgi:glycosyltransferase involved in cell wall biosynthesis